MSWYAVVSGQRKQPNTYETSAQNGRQRADLAQLEGQSYLCLLRPEQDLRIKDEFLSPQGDPVYANRHAANGSTRTPTNVDISSLLKVPDPNESYAPSNPQIQQTPVPLATQALATTGQPTTHATTPIAPSSMPGGRRSVPPQGSEQPSKKQSKWTPDEDALIIELRGGGMKWEDISKRLPGRSAISCRLHYQNYLERRSEWDEERKNKLARLYER